MNKQRQVLITTTYNEQGIIIDTKVEEVAQDEVGDTISRQMAINMANVMYAKCDTGDTMDLRDMIVAGLDCLPSAQLGRNRRERTGTDRNGQERTGTDRSGQEAELVDDQRV